jgi:hypothetical protein
MKLVLVPILAALAPSASATGVVLALDGSRCYHGAYEYYLTGNAMTQPYNDLLQGGWTVVETNLVTPAVLQGVDIFICGELNVGTTLAQSEYNALQTWLAAGGGIVCMGEGDAFAPANIQMAALINGPQYGGQYNPYGVTDVIVAPTHPLIQGPAGTVTTLTGFNAPGFWINPSPTSTVIATNPDNSAALVAVTYGGGRALLLNDIAYFAIPPSFSLDHERLWLNTIAWLAGAGTVVTSFCSGDGTATACPCGNAGATGAGCASSVSAGAILTGTGNASIGNDTFALVGSSMPNSSALYFQGTTRLLGGSGIAFGDGLRCVGGSIVRLGTSLNSAGASTYPETGDQPVSIRGACAAGDIRMYQVWYRNAAPFCTVATFNLSNGLEITWTP